MSMPKRTPDFMVSVLGNCWSHLGSQDAYPGVRTPTFSFLSPDWGQSMSDLGIPTSPFVGLTPPSETDWCISNTDSCPLSL